MQLLIKMMLRWLILIVVICCAAYVCLNKSQYFSYEVHVPNVTILQPYDLQNEFSTFNGGNTEFTSDYYDGIQGRPYGVNNLYRSDNALVRMPSVFNENMNNCKRKCYDGVAYVAPIDYLNDHPPVPVEIGWCLDECMVNSSAHLFID